jgi:hypothetical protein
VLAIERFWISVLLERRIHVVIRAAVATLLLVLSAAAQTRERDEFISVSFAVDGKKVACNDLKVELRLDARQILPKRTSGGFTVPTELNKTSSGSSPDKKIDVSVSCGEFTMNFPQLHPSWVSPGRWELGIAYPPYWIERFRYSTALEHGAWISYLVSECNDCDPGVVTTISHPTPPPSLLRRLRSEQPSASGEGARDIAYALAVFNDDYQQNRDYLMNLVTTCLSRPKDSPGDEVCDDKLLDYVTNLYWRGDNGLLDPLLQLADSRKDVIYEVGTFYGQLLDRHTSIALQGMRSLPIAKQQVICRLAGEDDFSMDPPKLERVVEGLHAAQDEVAERCLHEAERAAGHVP